MGIDLSRANFCVVKTSARGTDSGFHFLCFIPLLSPSYAYAIDNRLIREAQKAGGLKTKKATVTEALKEYITP